MKTELSIEEILRPLTNEQIDSLTRSELKIIVRGEQSLRKQYEEMQARVRQLEELNKELKEEKLLLENRYVNIKSKLFGPSSEKSFEKPEPKPKDPRKKRKKTSKKLTERYPNLPVMEREVTLTKLPTCTCCNEEMSDSGMYEESEFLTVIPRQYLITILKRKIYRCSKCHGNLQTAPNLPRIVPGSSYGDDVVIDATLSKYCDLIPMERYCAMAKRQGLEGLPVQSLINLSHKLAEFLNKVYLKIKEEVLSSMILLGDETPHRMLEGDKKHRWYLWCFSSLESTYFECRDTRSGDVAIGILVNAKAIYFLSDAYQGYCKAIREVNEIRKKQNIAPLIEVNCNAHARRGFKSLEEKNEDAATIINEYAKIYKKEKEVKENPEEAEKIRESMRSNFEKIKTLSQNNLNKYSSKSAMYTACNYFLNHYKQLTVCLEVPEVPIDNNQSERELRSPVVGRKTWYGTHSKKGAQTAAIHHTIVGSCKLAGVNPRQYYKKITDAILKNKPIFTPKEFAEKRE